MESNSGMILTGDNRRTRRKTCHSATLFATNPTWTDAGANLGLCVKRQATNRLSHGTDSAYESSSICNLHCLYYTLTNKWPSIIEVRAYFP